MLKTLHPPREFWLPCLVTMTVILLSSLVFVFRKLIMKKWPRIGSATPANAENTSSTSDSTSNSDSDSGRPDDGGGEYEVFLSFRGEDTRKGFTDFLYTYLVDAGVRTFRDNEELRLTKEIGPELVKAIKESKIFIPIFSKDYASSKWCLNELRQMVEMDHQIFPIFYDVEPSDVRNQRGSYEKAFRKHDKNVDNEIVKGWKDALRKVGELKGLELKKETDGHEGKLVKNVVEIVLKMLKKDYTVVPDHLVGIDHQIEELIGMLNVDDSNDVRIVGIHGMGGIGKTTISKVIFNQLCGRFEGCCFLEDVRETSKQRNGIVNLQVQLISKILQRKCPKINNVDEGVKTIKDTVYTKRVLIVLDDVDDNDQFDMLARKRNELYRGSRVIVTTRDKEVLNKIEGCKCYETPFMERDLSLKLFSKFAFMRDHPPDQGYDILSNRAVDTAAGLPLALVVIGSLLLGKEKDEWEDILRKLEDIPDKKIQEKLRISFEALDPGQQHIFLDIACLFIGKDKTYPVYMWDDCKFYPRNGINVLVRKSLVKVRDDNTFWMHDQLRDLGRYIGEKKIDEVGECSRLWRHKGALDILNEPTGTKKVVALCLDLSQEESHDYRFTKEEFGQLTNVRFLQVDYAHLSGDFESRLPSELRWLQWRRCPGNSASTKFNLKNLVILNLSFSEITDYWEVWSQIKKAKKLKVLDLSYNHGLRIAPDFSTHTALERLILHCCRCLEQIGTSIGSLINLKLLDISKCSSLKELPDVRNLHNLEELQIFECKNLPCILGLPSNLKLLDIKDCASLERLSFYQRSYEDGDQELQEGIRDSRSMEILRLEEDMPKQKQECVFSSGDEGGELPRLRELSIENCPKLEGGLPDYLPHLTTLKIDDCNQLKDSLPRSPLLCKLDLYNCSHRVLLVSCNDNLQQRFSWPCLKELTIRDMSDLKQLPPGLMQSLSAIESVTISHCPSLESLPISDLRHPTTLKRLKIEGYENLVDLIILPKPDAEIQIEPHSNYSYASLEHFEVWNNCNPMKSFPLGLFPKLDHLSLNEWINLECFWIPEGVPPHDHLLTSLRQLVINFCPKFESFPRGGLPAPNLRSLTIRHCPSLQSLPEGMHNLLPSLEELDIQGCPELELFPEGGLPSNLNSLIIGGCDKLTAHRMEWGLQRLSNLQFFEFVESEEVESFPEEGLLPSCLTSLRISELPDLQYIDKRGLQHLSSLKEIYISDCSELECLPLEGLPNSLSKLSIDSYCSSSLKDWCRRKKEEGWPPIAHIPEIVIDGDPL